ncbi:hypothetical protein MLD38_034433 [Melastoma candidum]|uniref:Uncharacterized protein n=1 Tax=Melastoma candidum TaxID=119954 RepID=A0ACB9MCH1_9MYRT|nr:hypothetical protein MLD38_034433 [Melastoma candidum]
MSLPLFLQQAFLSILLAVASAASSEMPWPPNCNRTCRGITPLKVDVKYPFGFSPGCPIRLNCTPEGSPLIGDFPVQSLTPDSITITVQARCDRPLRSIARLYGRNYAPTSKNALLLNNCSQPSSCQLPLTMVITQFDSQCYPRANASSSANMGCYSGVEKGGDFLDYGKLLGTNCGVLLSSISAELSTKLSVSLDVQIIQLGWWVNGEECRCSRHADCTQVQVVPSGGKGYRCRCREGYVGDGFLDGAGCQRESQCNPARYLSGECGGTTRLIVLAGGVVVGACAMIGLGVITCLVRRRYKAKLRLSAKRRVTEAMGQCTVPVYSFKEIERATNYFCDRQRPQGEVNLANLAVDRIGRGVLDEILDPFLEPEKDEGTWTSILKVAELAFCCLSYHRDLRPSMQEVADELERIRTSGWHGSMSGRSSLTTTATNTKAESISSNSIHKPTGEIIISLNSNESGIMDNLPESLPDSWTSEGSSNSSSGLVTNMIQ